MKFEFVVSPYLIKLGIVPFLLTLFSVFIIISLTILLVKKEIKKKDTKGADVDE